MYLYYFSLTIAVLEDSYFNRFYDILLSELVVFGYWDYKYKNPQREGWGFFNQCYVYCTSIVLVVVVASGAGELTTTFILSFL